MVVFLFVRCSKPIIEAKIKMKQYLQKKAKKHLEFKALYLDLKVVIALENR